MDKYGSDKPDLRIDLVLTDATEVMQGCGFAAFEGQTVKGYRGGWLHCYP